MTILDGRRRFCYDFTPINERICCPIHQETHAACLKTTINASWMAWYANVIDCSHGGLSTTPAGVLASALLTQPDFIFYTRKLCYRKDDRAMRPIM